MARGAAKDAQDRAVEATSAAHLEAAAAAAERAAWEGARDALVLAWQHRPSTRVGRLVALLDARLPTPVLEGRTVAERDARWLQLAATHDPAVLSTILGAPWPVHVKDAAERVEALATWPRSPRITHALLGVHERRQYRGARRNRGVGPKLSRRIFVILFDQGDPAISTYLARLEADRDHVDRDARVGLRAIMKRHRPIDPEPTAREAAALDRIGAIVEPRAATVRSRAQLVEAVYVAPFDDGPRSVLADLLIETGDPRGELIALQLQGKGSATRARALIRQAGNHWFDGLDRDGAFAIELARGFPVAAIARHAVFAEPAWATIEALSLASDQPFRGSPLLRGLRELYGLRVAELAGVTLPDPELAVLTVIGADRLDVPTALAPETLGIVASPRISIVDWRRDVRALAVALARWPIGRRVTTLRLELGINELDFALELAASTTVELALVDGRSYLRTPLWWAATLAGASLRLEWHGGDSMVPNFGAVVYALGRLARQASVIREVEVVTRARVPADELTRVRTALTSLVAMWPGVTRASILDPGR